LFAEQRISARVRHWLARRHAARPPTASPYIVMEYLDGENLGALADRGQLEIEAIVAIGAQIADALSALHDGGVIHCDVKLDNVFVLYETGFELAEGQGDRLRCVAILSTSRRSAMARSPERRRACRPSSGAALQSPKSVYSALGCAVRARHRRHRVSRHASRS
jgi:serine/threonine protein kinase